MTPDELRQYARLARQDAQEWRMMAEQYPRHKDRYLATANEREAHADFYDAKADRDEAWHGTQPEYLEVAA